MDADRFDALARALTISPSRRGVTRALTGLAFGSVLGSAWRAAGAKKK